jgi:prevent-host-death family protein
MQTITSTEFARNPRGVFDRVIETQAPIEVTRHGKPVVRVQPIAPARRTLSGPELVARMAASTRSSTRLKSSLIRGRASRQFGADRGDQQ